jgi:hypothetical protein
MVFLTHKIEEKKMILYTCKLANGFFNSRMRRIERILHICEPTIGFFDSCKIRKEMTCMLVG